MAPNSAKARHCMANMPKRRWYRLSPDRFMAGLILVVGLLWSSKCFQWSGFNNHKGWTVLIAIVAVALWAAASTVRRIGAIVCRRRFQFSLRSLLLFFMAASIACSWLGVDMTRARRQAAAIRAITSDGGSAEYNWQYSSCWPCWQVER